MSVQTYQIFKLLHILGTILFVGNILVTAVWKTMADHTREPRVVAFGQRMVTITDVLFTGIGAALVLISGLTMVASTGINLMKVRWLAWGFGLFTLSAIIWVAALIPIQLLQSRLARQFDVSGDIPATYWRLGRLWMIFGSLATFLPLCNLYFMIFKPD